MKKVFSLAIIAMCMIGCNQNSPSEVYPVKGRDYQYYSTHPDDMQAYTLQQILNTEVTYYDLYFRTDDTVEFFHSEWKYVPNPDIEGRAMPEFTLEQKFNAPYKQNGGRVTIYSSPELIVSSNWKDSIRYNDVFLQYNPDHGYVGDANLH